MSSPFTERLRLAGSVAGGIRPQMATALANSDLSDGDIKLAGGFAKSLDDATLVRLSRAAGAKLDLSPDQRSRLDAIQENYADVHAGPSEDSPDSRNWLERVTEGFASAVSNTGQALFHNSVSKFIFGALDGLNDAVHLPARMISSALDTSNDDEVDAAMKAKGYDTNSAWDYVQFMTTQGDSLYHDLDGLRQTYDDQLVDLAIEQNADPEGFASRLAKRGADIQELVNSDKFAQVSDLVDRQHISPGRDLARLITFGNTDSPAFTAISGVLDAAYTIMLDPTLVAGKVLRGARALDAAGEALGAASRVDRLTAVPQLTKGFDALTKGRYRTGLRDALDMDGIKSLLTHNTQAGRNAQAFLDDAAKLRGAEDPVERGAIFARMNALYKPWMPFLDEVGGTRVLEHKFTDVEQARQIRQDLLDSAGIDEATKVLPSQFDHATVVPGDQILVREGENGLVGDATVIDRNSGAQRRTVVAKRHQQVSRPKTNGKKGNNRFHIWEYDLEGGGTVRFEQPFTKKASNLPYVVKADQVPTAPIMPVPEAAAFDRKLIDAQGIGWMAAKGKEITTLDDFADYMANTAGFLRLAHGAAAKRELLLPGRISLSARFIASQAGRRARKGGLIFDHTKPYQFMPNEVEEGLQTQLDDGTLTAGDAMYNLRTRGTVDGTGYNPFRKAAAKWEQRARRVSSIIPTVNRINLTSADGTEQVRRLARLYLPKAEADRLAGLYAVSDLGRRREIVAGVNEQIFHAAGLSRSAEGLAQIEKFRADQLGLDKRAYGLNRTDVIKTDAGERHVALLPSQLSEDVLIPDFKSLQYLASKYVVGGYLARTAGTIRAGFNGDAMDQVSHAVKMGWITSAAGGFRNALDEVVGASITGGGESLLHGRVMFSQATEGVRASRAESRRAARLERGMIGRIPLSLRGASDKVNDVLVAKGLGKLWSFKPESETTLKDIAYTERFVKAVQAGEVRESLTGTYFADDASRIIGEDGVASAAADGVMMAPVRFNGEAARHVFDGYKQVEIDGGIGLDSFVDNLGMAFQDLTSPAHVALRGLITPGEDVLANVVTYMQSDVMRHFRENAEMFKWTRDGKVAVTGDQQLEAIERYSENLIAHVAMLVSGRGERVADEAGNLLHYANDIASEGYQGLGPINADLAKMLQKGQIPDRAWVKENLDETELPMHTVQKTWLPVNPAHAVGQLAQGYTSLLTKAYGKVVTDQVNALSRNPMMTAAYVQARHNIDVYEQHLIDNGFAPEIADNMAHRMGMRQAEEAVIRMVDNPTVSSQYSIIARNFHAFARAQEDWLRRWGRIIKDDPTVIRRGQLAIHGGESAGIVEKDDQGNLTFTYPGSGMVLQAFAHVGKAFGLTDMVKIPMMPDMSSQLIFLNPSLDNPVGFSAMPVISVPFKAMAATLGADYPLLTASADKILNGQLGAGRHWYESMLPGFANRIISGVIKTDDPMSQFASAYTSALMNFSAAGRIDELDLTDATALANFQHDLKSQIVNQMVARSLFGFFAPAAPSLPTNDVQTAEGDWILKPDFAYQKLGIKSLKDEARKIFSEMPYEQALEYWTKNHPGELIYAQGEVARTKVGTEDAQAFATINAAKWMEDNPYLLKQYGGKGGVAAFFIPQGQAGTQGGTFSQVAYRAQLEQGMREHKTLDEYFNDIVIQRGEAQYYDTKDDYKAEINAAIASGNKVRAKQLEAEWATASEVLKGANPLMAQKFAAFATSGVGRDQTLTQLNKMLGDPKAVAALGEQSAGVAQLMLAERQYEAARQAILGKRGVQATAQRASNASQYEATVAAIVAQYPGLGDLARGVFRVPNN